MTDGIDGVENLSDPTDTGTETPDRPSDHERETQRQNELNAEREEHARRTAGG